VSLKEERNIDCTLCKRETPLDYQEKHHLIPKSSRGKDTIIVCVDCGNQVHRLFTLKQLQDIYNTIEMLQSDSRMIKWIKWIKKQKNFGVCHKTKKKRK